MTAPEISIVAPVYNEEENLPELARQIREVMSGWGKTYEVILVDDGSRDRSRQVIKNLIAQDSHVRLVGFAKNAGETAAHDAGTRAARGDVIVTIDSDLQNDPHDIPRLVSALGDYDLVSGWRRKREDSLLKRFSSRVANFVREAFTGDSVRDSGCTYRAFRRECLKKIKLYRGMHRFMPTLFKMEGFRICEIEVEHHPRRFGKSKYGVLNRVFRAFVDLMAVRWMRSRALRYEIDEEVDIRSDET